MRKTIRRYWSHIVYALFAKQWNTSISAVDAFIGLAVGASISPDVHAINWKGAAAVFLTTWVRSGLQYFRDNPLPPELPHDDNGPAPVVPLPGSDFEKLPEVETKVTKLP